MLYFILFTPNVVTIFNLGIWNMGTFKLWQKYAPYSSGKFDKKDQGFLTFFNCLHPEYLENFSFTPRP